MNQGLRCGSFSTAAAAWRPSDALSAPVLHTLEVIKPYVHGAVITLHPQTKNQYTPVTKIWLKLRKIPAGAVTNVV